jgi:hypothetical protein
MLARLRTCLPRLIRFLVSSSSQRLQQEADLRQWLTERLHIVAPLAERPEGAVMGNLLMFALMLSDLPLYDQYDITQRLCFSFIPE